MLSNAASALLLRFDTGIALRNVYSCRPLLSNTLDIALFFVGRQSAPLALGLKSDESALIILASSGICRRQRAQAALQKNGPCDADICRRHKTSDDKALSKRAHSHPPVGSNAMYLTSFFAKILDEFSHNLSGVFFRSRFARYHCERRKTYPRDINTDKNG